MYLATALNLVYVLGPRLPVDVVYVVASHDLVFLIEGIEDGALLPTIAVVPSE